MHKYTWVDVNQMEISLMHWTLVALLIFYMHVLKVHKGKRWGSGGFSAGCCMNGKGSLVPARGHVEVEGFLDWQFSRVFGLVHHCGLFPSDGVVILASVLSCCWLRHHPSLAGIPVLLQSGHKSPLGLPDVGIATAAGDPVHHLGLLLHWQGVLHFGQHRVVWPSRSEDHSHAVPSADLPDVFSDPCCVW